MVNGKRLMLNGFFCSRLTIYGLRFTAYCFLNQLRKAGFGIAEPGKIRFKIKTLALSQPNDVVTRYIQLQKRILSKSPGGKCNLT